MLLQTNWSSMGNIARMCHLIGGLFSLGILAMIITGIAYTSNSMPASNERTMGFLLMIFGGLLSIIPIFYFCWVAEQRDRNVFGIFTIKAFPSIEIAPETEITIPITPETQYPKSDAISEEEMNEVEFSKAIYNTFQKSDIFKEMMRRANYEEIVKSSQPHRNRWATNIRNPASKLHSLIERDEVLYDNLFDCTELVKVYPNFAIKGDEEKEYAEPVSDDLNVCDEGYQEGTENAEHNVKYTYKKDGNYTTILKEAMQKSSVIKSEGSEYFRVKSEMFDSEKVDTPHGVVYYEKYGPKRIYQDSPVVKRVIRELEEPESARSSVANDGSHHQCLHYDEEQKSMVTCQNMSSFKSQEGVSLEGRIRKNSWTNSSTEETRFGIDENSSFEGDKYKNNTFVEEKTQLNVVVSLNNNDKMLQGMNSQKNSSSHAGVRINYKKLHPGVEHVTEEEARKISGISSISVISDDGIYEIIAYETPHDVRDCTTFLDKESMKRRQTDQLVNSKTALEMEIVEVGDVYVKENNHTNNAEEHQAGDTSYFCGSAALSSHTSESERDNNSLNSDYDFVTNPMQEVRRKKIDDLSFAGSLEDIRAAQEQADGNESDSLSRSSSLPDINQSEKVFLSKSKTFKLKRTLEILREKVLDGSETGVSDSKYIPRSPHIRRGAIISLYGSGEPHQMHEKHVAFGCRAIKLISETSITNNAPIDAHISPNDATDGNILDTKDTKLDENKAPMTLIIDKKDMRPKSRRRVGVVDQRIVHRRTPPIKYANLVSYNHPTRRIERYENNPLNILHKVEAKSHICLIRSPSLDDPRHHIKEYKEVEETGKSDDPDNREWKTPPVKDLVKKYEEKLAKRTSTSSSGNDSMVSSISSVHSSLSQSSLKRTTKSVIIETAKDTQMARQNVAKKPFMKQPFFHSITASAPGLYTSKQKPFKKQQSSSSLNSSSSSSSSSSACTQNPSPPPLPPSSMVPALRPITSASSISHRKPPSPPPLPLPPLVVSPITNYVNTKTLEIMNASQIKTESHRTVPITEHSTIKSVNTNPISREPYKLFSLPNSQNSNPFRESHIPSKHVPIKEMSSPNTQRFESSRESATNFKPFNISTYFAENLEQKLLLKRPFAQRRAPILSQSPQPMTKPHIAEHTSTLESNIFVSHFPTIPHPPPLPLVHTPTSRWSSASNPAPILLKQPPSLISNSSMRDLTDEGSLGKIMNEFMHRFSENTTVKPVVIKPSEVAKMNKLIGIYQQKTNIKHSVNL